MCAEKAKDRIRAAAWQLAAEASKQEAAKFLRQMADEIDKQLWDHNR